ncbi:MAG: T9SS type A sorting domain-containing protein [Ignavibacteria bacterium]|nr:T9SS type A sorting domain-containing protein [Ignavibacteria bacterium]MBK7159388.1 T9SS type A sorting domain-containing protein [Ignavibacteria bacterium]
MKKLFTQLFIICVFATGFRGSCFFVPTDLENPLSILVYGFRYNGSDAGFVDNYYLAAGTNGKIYRSTDPVSDPWTEMVSVTSNDLHSLSVCERYDTAVTFAVGDNGTIIKSLDQGLTWSVMNSGVSGKLNSVDFIGSDIDNAIAVGNSGVILTTTNGGINWINVSTGITKNLNSVYAQNSFTVFIAGDDGTILRSSNSGLNWQNTSLPDSTADLNKIGEMGVWFFGYILGITGDNGKLYRTTDLFSWNSIPTETNEDLYELKFKNASSGYIAGENGTVRYTTDGGNVWYSDLFLSSITTDRINSSLIINDTTSVGVAGNRIILMHANESLLPVELSLFTYSVKNSDVHLNWTTSSEVNNSGFDIERSNVNSQNSGDWTKIGFINGNGTSSSPNNYEFTDRNLNSGKYNYRLKQIDFNGNYEYFNLSGEVVIGVPEKFELSQNYPNPFNPVTKLEFGISKLGFVTLKVYNSQGKEVATLVNEIKPAGRYDVTFDGSNFSSGVYFYKLESNGFIETKKMFLIK